MKPVYSLLTSWVGLRSPSRPQISTDHKVVGLEAACERSLPPNKLWMRHEAKIIIKRRDKLLFAFKRQVSVLHDDFFREKKTYVKKEKQQQTFVLQIHMLFCCSAQLFQLRVTQLKEPDMNLKYRTPQGPKHLYAILKYLENPWTIFFPFCNFY